MLLFGKMTLEYAWGMRRRISPCSVILPSISYGRTRLPNWGFKTNASKLAGMIPTWLRLCLGKSFNAIALGSRLAFSQLAPPREDAWPAPLKVARPAPSQAANRGVRPHPVAPELQPSVLIMLRQRRIPLQATVQSWL